MDVEQGFQQAPSYVVAAEDVVDTVGAGDYFCGAFLAARSRGASLPDCLREGCRVGAEVVRHSGADLPEEAWAKLHAELADVASTSAA